MLPGYPGAPPRIDFVDERYASSARHLERVTELSQEEVDKIWALQRAMHDREGEHLERLMRERLAEEREKNSRLQFLDRDTVTFLKVHAAALVQEDFGRLVEAANAGATYEEIWEHWPEILEGKWVGGFTQPLAPVAVSAEPAAGVVAEPEAAATPVDQVLVVPVPEAAPAAKPAPKPGRGRAACLAESLKNRADITWADMLGGWQKPEQPAVVVEQVKLPPEATPAEEAPIALAEPAQPHVLEATQPAAEEVPPDGRSKKPPQEGKIPALSGVGLDEAAAKLRKAWEAPIPGEPPTYDTHDEEKSS